MPGPLISPGLMVAGGIGDAVSQGIDTYLKVKGLKNEEAYRNKTLGLLAAKQGLSYDPNAQAGATNPNTGNPVDASGFSQTPLLQAQTQANIAEAQRKIDSNSPSSQYSISRRGFMKSSLNTVHPGLGDKLVTDDMSANDVDEKVAKQVLEGEYGVKKAEAGASIRVTNQQDRLDNTNHQQLLRAVKKDDILGSLQTTSQNLQNALTNLDRSGEITPQAFQDLQQVVATNAGVKGPGGVGERQDRYMNSIGLKGDNLKQFLTGNPSDLGQDNKMVNYFKQLANFELQNKAQQVQERLDKLTAGNESMYERRPDLKSGLDSIISKFSINRPKGAQGMMPPAQSQPQFQEGQTATGPNGEKIVFKGGQWTGIK